MLKLDKDTRAFTETFNDYYPLIYSTVYTKVGDAVDAEDITQEVFARLYEKQNKVENTRKWLYGAMQNVIMEYYRKKAGSEASVEDYTSDISLTFVNGFRDTRLMIQEALDSIENFEDETEKVLFDLIAIHNFTYKHVAAHLGLTERQVRYRYNVLVARISHYFEQKGIKSLEDLL